MLDAAQAQYLKLLKASPAAIRYLKQRGLTGEIAAHFGLGWSGTDRHGLSQVFPNYDDPALVEAGLVIESEDGRRYDRFRERVMFPIRNARGSLIGFGGRIIGKGEPKYLNSPETPLFSKGQELYGLWEARQAIRQEGQVIVVEGYMDVVGLAQHRQRGGDAGHGDDARPCEEAAARQRQGHLQLRRRRRGPRAARPAGLPAGAARRHRDPLPFPAGRARSRFLCARTRR